MRSDCVAEMGEKLDALKKPACGFLSSRMTTWWTQVQVAGVLILPTLLH